MAKYHLHLAHLYGDLLNTYSDVGNINLGMCAEI